MRFIVLTILTILLLSSCSQPPQRPPIQFINNQALANQANNPDPEPAQRPDGVILFNTGYCACLEGKSTIIGNCDSFCSEKNVTQETLYMTFQETEELTLSPLSNLDGWCNQALDDAEDEQLNPSCRLVFKEPNGGIIPLEFQHTPGTNSLTAILEGQLNFDILYRIYLEENTSGAKSNTVQMTRVREQFQSPISTPLALAPVSQYTCFGLINSEGGSETNPVIFNEAAFRLHFYFIPESRPDPIPPGFDNFFCHDKQALGNTDNELYARLEETPGVFTLWDKEDPRFKDNFDDGEDVMDIHKLIQQSVVNQGFTMDTPPQLFFPFTWPGPPELNSEAGNNQGNNLPLGYYMTPWIDADDNYRAYCPKAQQYLSTDPIFTAMRETVAIDTEGLYIGVKPASNVVTTTGVEETPNDFILIREGLLKKIWFYIENQAFIRPTDETVRGKKIRFYWPPSVESPYVKKSHQVLYTVYSVNELQNLNNANVDNNGSSTTGGFSSQITPHDKRFGCIPVSNDIY
jgi:hypothetical protein